MRTPMNSIKPLTICLLAALVLNGAYAGEVKVIAAELHKQSTGHWSVNVTLRHGDTGWDHYADNWRVVDGEGNVLGERVLYHPHEEEQPFTRGLNDVQIPSDLDAVYIVAHDKQHGWSSGKMRIDLNMVNNGRISVEAE